LSADTTKNLRIIAVVDGLRDPLSNRVHLRLTHTAGGQGRAADADSAGFQRRIGVVGNWVLVYSNSGFMQGKLGFATQNAAGKNVYQHQMGVSPTRNHTIPFGGQGLRQSLRIGDHLLGVLFESRLQRLTKSHGLAGNDVNQRSTLLAWENTAVDCGGKLLLTEDHAGTRSPKRLMGGGGDEMRVGYRRRMNATSYQAGKMRHIH